MKINSKKIILKNVSSVSIRFEALPYTEADLFGPARAGQATHLAISY